MPADERWAEYARTVVDVVVPGVAIWRIRPAPSGQVGRWPVEFTVPVHVLTAWDPGGARPGEAENRRRQDALERDLDALDVTRWRAVGRDLESGHSEEGVAVAGLGEAAALALGRRYGQDAVFCWTPEAWRVVSCVDQAFVSAGWRIDAR